MLKLETVRDIGKFEWLRLEWNELLKASSSNSVFLTWEWLFTWWKHLSGRRQLHLLVLRRDNKLVGVAPLAIRARQPERLIPFRTLEFLGTGTVGSDYLDLIIRRGEEDDVLKALTSYLLHHKLVIEFTRVKATSMLVARLESELVDRGWAVSHTTVGVCPYIDLSDMSWDSYLQTLGPAHRANVRRRTKSAIKKFELKLELPNSERHRSIYFAMFVDLHRKRWESRDDVDEMDTPDMLQFHAELSRIASQREWLRLFILFLDGVPAAAIYAFMYNNKYYFYQSGFDPAFSRYSVGLVMMGLTIKAAIDEGADEYDMLHGNESYKYLWAQAHRDLVRINLYPRTAIGILYRRAIDLKMGIKKCIRWPRQLQVN